MRPRQPPWQQPSEPPRVDGSQPAIETGQKILLARWGQVHHDNGFGPTRCGIMIPQAATEVSDSQFARAWPDAVPRVFPDRAGQETAMIAPV